MILKKWANPGLFFHLSSSFQTHIAILRMRKNDHPVYGAGIRTHDFGTWGANDEILVYLFQFGLLETLRLSSVQDNIIGAHSS